MNPSISVIIPCRNGSRYLAEAIGSVFRQGMDMELVVIDDGSTDDTSRIAANLGCQVERIPHSGLSAARNRGLALARGRFILFLDHDDRIREGAMQTLVQAAESLAEPGIVQGKALDFISPELTEAERQVLAPRTGPYYGLLSGCVVFHKNVFAQIGTFTEQLATGQTMDILLRAEQHGIPATRLDLIATDRRLHNENMGRTMQQQEHKDYAALLRRKLAAQRTRDGQR